ncbi:hypothetical protein M758_9G171000 [Ceratodon purpureus]|nr:hypothetical protein M758_9G171000 [Ceratodon purpureus]
MTRSGTSGILRFRNKEPNGSIFEVALGVHNFKRWCDIVDNSEKAETAVMVHPTYYPDKDGNHDYPGNRWDVLWKQRDNFEMTLDSSGFTVTVDYYVKDGFDLCATITVIDNGGDNDDE